MSRIGRQPISIPDKVSIEIAQKRLLVKGPKGELSLELLAPIDLEEDGQKLVVKRRGDDRTSRSLHGLTRTLIANMITGVSDGWERTLELVGVGHRAKLEGQELVLSLGFSHPVRIKPPEGVTFKVDENRIIVSGIDKALVGQTAANLRALKRPEPYKGKGIRYLGEVVRLKPGKTVKVGTGFGG